MVWQHQDSWQKKPFCFFDRKRWLPSAQRWDWNSLLSPKTAGRQMTSRGQGGSEMELDGVSSRFGGRAQMEHTTRVTRVELWSAIKHDPLCREHYWTEWRTSRAQIFPFVQSSIVCWISQNLDPILSERRQGPHLLGNQTSQRVDTELQGIDRGRHRVGLASKRGNLPPSDQVCEQACWQRGGQIGN